MLKKSIVVLTFTPGTTSLFPETLVEEKNGGHWICWSFIRVGNCGLGGGAIPGRVLQSNDPGDCPPECIWF